MHEVPHVAELVGDSVQVPEALRDLHRDAEADPRPKPETRPRRARREELPHRPAAHVLEDDP